MTINEGTFYMCMMTRPSVPRRRPGHTLRSREGLVAAAAAARHPLGFGPGVVLKRWRMPTPFVN